MFTQSKIITSSAFSPPVVTPRGQNSPSNSRPHLQVLIPESLTQPQRLLRHRPRVPWRRLRQDAREEIQRQDVRPGARNNGVRVQRCPKKHARKTWKSLNNNYLSIIVRYDDVCEFKWLNNWKKEVQWFGQWFTTWKCKTWEPCKISWLKEQKMCFLENQVVIRWKQNPIGFWKSCSLFRGPRNWVNADFWTKLSCREGYWCVTNQTKKQQKGNV